MTDHKDQSKRSTPDPTSATARTRLARVDLQLGGVLGAVTDGFRDIADRLEALGEVEHGSVHLDHRLHIGSLIGFREATRARLRPMPEHEVRQTATDWSLTVQLPDASLTDIRIECQPGRLSIDTRDYHLSVSLPKDLAREKMALGFQDGRLSLTAPRRGAET